MSWKSININTLLKIGDLVLITNCEPKGRYVGEVTHIPGNHEDYSEGGDCTVRQTEHLPKFKADYEGIKEDCYVPDVLYELNDGLYHPKPHCPTPGDIDRRINSDSWVIAVWTPGINHGEVDV